MTDWKEQARKHEESANEYARMNYELEAINADLLEALKACVEKLEAHNLEHCRAGYLADEAIRKAEEQS